VKDGVVPAGDRLSLSALLQLCEEAAAAMAAAVRSRSDPNDLHEVEVATPYGHPRLVHACSIDVRRSRPASTPEPSLDRGDDPCSSAVRGLPSP
jgi:hypothetical protein